MLYRKIYENLSAQLFLVIDIDASSLIPCTCINNSSYHTVFQAKNKSIMVKRSKEPSPDQMRTEDRSSLQASNYLLIGGWIFDGQSPHERMICMFSSRLQSYQTYNSAHDTYDSYGNDNWITYIMLLLPWLHREAPLEWMQLCLLSHGAQLGWEGPSSPFPVTEESITHQIIDRPAQGTDHVKNIGRLHGAFFEKSSWITPIVTCFLSYSQF